jgi:hypothetical protein
MTDKSPFVRPAVMRGYPLDPAEKAAVEHAMRKVEHADANGAAREDRKPRRNDERGSGLLTTTPTP